MATLTLKKPEDKKPEGMVEITIHTGGERYAFSCTASQLRGTIPASRVSTKALKALVLPALEKVLGRVR